MVKAFKPQEFLGGNLVKYNPEIHHRCSIRLKGYDYSRSGEYFVSICTQNQEHLFGEIIKGKMDLNDVGRMVERIWDALPKHYEGVAIDAFVIMPNHIHGIIVLRGPEPEPVSDHPDCVGAGPRACPSSDGVSSKTDEPAQSVPSSELGQARGPAPTGSGPLQTAPSPESGPAPTMSLPDVVHRFKSLTTACYRNGVKQNGWRPFSGKLWQRNYYEHIVRNDDEWNRIRQYIVDNPKKGESDRRNSVEFSNSNF